MYTVGASMQHADCFSRSSPHFSYLRVAALKTPVATGNTNLQASNLHTENGKPESVTISFVGIKPFCTVWD